MSIHRMSSRVTSGSDRPRVVQEPPRNARNRRRIGNALVAGQFGLIAVCLMPWGPTVGTGHRGIGLALIVLAGVVGVLALRSLGRSTRVHPVPGPGSALRTDGIYAVIRHPMYAAVLLACTGVAVSTGRVLSIGAVLSLAVLLHAKARFEDRMLAEQYGWRYAVYAQRVPALLPWPRPLEPR